ncbi:MAG: hypothetical protein Q7S88_00410, partial [Candidatus Daviesbacteria bacterium]|nr:hypothetical protein [Candidatus Daviesbacteria bacterium]
MEQAKIEDINQIDQEPRQQLVATLMVLRRLRDKSESTMDSKGSFGAERTILANIPVISNLTNGDLKGTSSNRALSDDSHLQIGVSRLSETEVKETQAGLGKLLSLVKAIGSVSVGRRLDVYLPVTLPDTNDGFKALLYMAQNVEITEQSGVPETFAATLKVLRQLDQQVYVAGR